MKKGSLSILFIIIGLASISSTVVAHDSSFMGGDDDSRGPGMMGSYGGGMMSGYGPGMMGHGYGRDMMSGCDYGVGMMQGYDGDTEAQNLSAQQLGRLRAIQQQLITLQTPLMRQMVTRREELRSLYLDPALDPEAISDKYSQIFTLRQQMIKRNLEAHQQTLEVLQQSRQ